MPACTWLTCTANIKPFVRKGGTANGFESKKEPLLQYQGASVAVTIRTRGTMPDTSTFIHHIGGELIYRDSTYGTVDAWIPISQLTTLSTNGIVANQTGPTPQTFTQDMADNHARPG